MSCFVRGGGSSVWRWYLHNYGSSIFREYILTRAKLFDTCVINIYLFKQIDLILQENMVLRWSSDIFGDLWWSSVLLWGNTCSRSSLKILKGTMWAQSFATIHECSEAWPVDASNISFSNPACYGANGPNMTDGSWVLCLAQIWDKTVALPLRRSRNNALGHVKSRMNAGITGASTRAAFPRSCCRLRNEQSSTGLVWHWHSYISWC